MVFIKFGSKVVKYLFLTGVMMVLVVFYHFHTKHGGSAGKSDQYLSEEQHAILRTRESNLWEEFAKLQEELQQKQDQLSNSPQQQVGLKHLQKTKAQILQEFDNIQQKFAQDKHGQHQGKWTSWEDFNIRKRRIHYVCSNEQVPGSVNQVLTNNFGVIYCIVPKAGCTFWKRVFGAVKSQVTDKPDVDLESSFTVRKNVTLTSINTISRESVHNPDIGLQLYNKSIHKDLPTRLIVTRNPFSRLLSSYLDKVYLPDFWLAETSVWLWKTYKIAFSSPQHDFLRQHFNTMYTLLNVNLSASKISTSEEKRCGKYMTFTEFIELGFTRNEPHWMPMHTICNPCIFNVSHVSLMDTFSQDARAILSKMRLEHVMDELDETAQVNEEIRSISDYNFQHFYTNVTAKFYEPCITHKEIAYRLWHNFRWRGYIDPEVEYKIPEFNEQKQVEEDFMTQVWAARASGLQNPGRMKNAKNEFKQKAFKSISKLMFQKLVKKYELDFQLFGYTDVRDSLFSLYNNT